MALKLMFKGLWKNVWFANKITWKKLTPQVFYVKFGSINNHSPMRGHMGHREASQGDLENQPVL
jgi:hypothetical protein